MIALQIQHSRDGDEQFAGQYIRDYDPAREDEQGYGFLTVTKDIAKAKRFADYGEAHLFWVQQSKTKPIRDDGRPNRPLGGFSVEFIRLDGEDR